MNEMDKRKEYVNELWSYRLSNRVYIVYYTFGVGILVYTLCY